MNRLEEYKWREVKCIIPILCGHNKSKSNFSWNVYKIAMKYTDIISHENIFHRIQYLLYTSPSVTLSNLKKKKTTKIIRPLLLKQTKVNNYQKHVMIIC